MIASRDTHCMACSQDGIGYINIQCLRLPHNNSIGDNVNAKLASSEIRTSVASTRLKERNRYASSNVHTCSVAEKKFLQLILREHCGLLIQKAMVLHVSYVVYVSASETSLIYVVVFFFPTEFVSHCREVLWKAGGKVVN